MIAAMISILSAVTLAVLHYTASGRKHFNITNDVPSVQDIVTIAVLLFLALCFISLGICIKRRNRVLPYRQLQSDIGLYTVLLMARRTVHPVQRVSQLPQRKFERQNRNKDFRSSGSSSHLTLQQILPSLCPAQALVKSSMPEPV